MSPDVGHKRVRQKTDTAESQRDDEEPKREPAGSPAATRIEQKAERRECALGGGLLANGGDRSRSDAARRPLLAGGMPAVAALAFAGRVRHGRIFGIV